MLAMTITTHTLICGNFHTGRLTEKNPWKTPVIPHLRKKKKRKKGTKPQPPSPPKSSTLFWHPLRTTVVVTDILSHRCPQTAMPTLPPTEIISWNWAAPEHTISGFLPQGGASQALIQTITAISIPHPSQLTHWWWCYMLFTVQKHQCFTSISTIWEAKDQIASTQWVKVKMTHS